MEPTINRPRWYKTGWGVALLGLFALFIFGLLFVSGLTGYYWWQIKHGKSILLQQQFNTSFSESVKSVKGIATAPNRANLETADSPTLGRSDSPLVIVEFIDFKCPNCLAEAPILQRVIGAYGTKIKLLIREFPAESIHPGATQLANLAVCADKQGRFWPLHNLLFQRQNSLPSPLTTVDIDELASQVNLNVDALHACLVAPSTEQKVRTDYFAGIQAGVRGTPTFFINGAKVEGAVSFDAWQKYLDSVGF